ncbi:MFS transporter [Halioxenophilus aromaticivorans]|uniref:MFS transporter n=1 Tax=Halioxenophilus aromaticivorans TaxID=1306992 RepID=UPI0031EC20CB
MLFSVQSHSALREPLYRRYFLASCLGTLASWMVRFSLGWLAWDLTHTVFWVGVASAGMLLPTFLLSPIFGVLSDRFNPRNGLLVTTLSQGVVAGLVALAMALGMFSLPVLLVASVLVGAVSAAHHPIRLAFIPRIVGRQALPSAIGLSATMFNTSRVLGPALSGALIANASVVFTLLFATGAYLASTIALTRVKLDYQPSTVQHKSILAELLEGIRTSAGRPVIRLILLLTVFNGLLGRTLLELLPALSGKLLGGSASELAWLTAAAGVGSIIGGLIIARLRDNHGLLFRIVIAGLAVAAVSLVPLYMAAQLWLLALLVGVVSLVTTVTGISSQALAQLTVADDMRGRVMSLWTVCSMGSPAIGTFGVGAVADHVGFATTLNAMAALALVALFWVWLPVRRQIRRAQAVNPSA